jgi:selenocysteine-specific elongation factor
MCVTQFDSKDFERGLLCSPGALPTIDAAIIDLNKINYYKGTITTKSKFHISMMHDTVMARLSVFGYYGSKDDLPVDGFDFSKHYLYQDELLTSNDGQQPFPSLQFALLEFEHPVTCSNSCLVIGSKLDTDIHANVCRIAFHGKLLFPMADQKYQVNILPQLNVYKDKTKEGLVERKADEYSVVCRGLFKKESKIDQFVGLKVKLSTGEDGVIEGSFGQSGKFKVRVPGRFDLII